MFNSKKMMEKWWDWRVNEGLLNESDKLSIEFVKEKGTLFVRNRSRGHDFELYKDDIEQIIKMYKKFKNKLLPF